MQFLLLVMCLLTALPASAACPPLIPAENLWQLTAGVYCLASKIDFEIETLECSFIDGACSCVDASTSVLSTLDELILSDVDSVSSKVDVLLECTLGTQITQAMVPYTISTPGHYYLCESVTAAGAPTISVNASDVYINLNGFTVSNTNNFGINTASPGLSNITIENGSISNTSQVTVAMGSATNLTLRNLACGSDTAPAVVSLGSITDLVVEDCYITARGTGFRGLEVDSIRGGRIENVFAYNVPFYGIRVISVAANSTVEIINCMADTGNIGFYLEAASGVVVRDCVASGTDRGFQLAGSHTLENCVSHNCTFGYWVEAVTNPIFRGCIAKDNGLYGFRFISTSNLVCANCIAQNNGSIGFFLDGAATGTNLDSCLAFANSGAGFYINVAVVNTRLTNCIASGNNTGIFEALGATGTFIVDCRSQHAATAVNPDYNLNTNPDGFNGAVQVIIS